MGNAAPYATLTAMVTGAYGAFETLAEDLWIATANKHFGLAMAFIKSFPQRQADMVALLGDGPDLTYRMGTILGRTKKIQFNSLGDIQDNYRRTFSSGIASVLDDFSGVRTAEKIRHLLAHRGGVVDARFRAK